MSYNITNMRTKHVYAELPPDFDFEQWVRGLPDRKNGYENVGKRWLLEDFDGHRLTSTSLVPATNTWSISMCNQGISGIIDGDGKRIVASLDDWTGDCSGILYIDILLPLFVALKGNLEAFITWEGGDSFTLLTIKDGVIDEQNRE